MHDLTFFTIVANNYIAYAKTLTDSLVRVYPKSKVFVIICDEPKKTPEANLHESVEIVYVEDLGIENIDDMISRYDVMELSTAIKPFAFTYIFEKTSSSVVYLDPDILVISPMSDVELALEENANAVLTPHIAKRIDDKLLPNEMSFLQVGIYNLGFIAIANSEVGKAIAKWWSDRLSLYAVNDVRNGLFTDQKWADLIPALFEGVKILRNSNINVAYWNLFQRNICDEKQITVDGLPLSFFHFSGVDFNNPDAFSKHQNRISVDDIGVLKGTYRNYVNSLIENGHLQHQKIPYAYDFDSNGHNIHKSMRVYYRRYTNDFDGSIRSKSIDFWNEIDKNIVANNELTRFMYALWLSSPEIQAEFDIRKSLGRDAYCLWFATHSQRDYCIPGIYIDESKLLPKHQLEKKKFFNFLVGFAYKVYKRHPGLIVSLYHLMPRKIKNLALGSVKSSVADEHFKNKSVRKNYLTNNKFLVSCKQLFHRALRFKKPKYDLTIIGYPKGDFGVAENCRSVARAVEEAGINYNIFNLGTSGVYSETNIDYESRIDNTAMSRIQIFCVNADQTPSAIEVTRRVSPSSAYRIAIWFWELEKFPNDWLKHIDLIDEFWAPSKFIAQMLKKVTNKKVLDFPVAVEFENVTAMDRETFGLHDDDFLFVFNYDFHSFKSRKNPEGVISAFKHAFKNDEKVKLVIKTINSDKHIDKLQDLKDECSSDHRITLVNETFSRSAMYSFIKMADCYVSLHRSEGLGLGMAESMLLGVPVIATAYSGNLTFMSNDNGALVDYELIPVKDGEYPFNEDQYWANPSIEHAALYMKKIFSDSHYRHEISERAACDIKSSNSVKSSASVIYERMQNLKRVGYV